MRIEARQVHERFDELLQFVAAGQRVVICREGRPIAEMMGVSSPPKWPRPIGLAAGRVRVPPEFFDPLPDDLLDMFEGKGERGAS